MCRAAGCTPRSRRSEQSTLRKVPVPLNAPLLAAAACTAALLNAERTATLSHPSQSRPTTASTFCGGPPSRSGGVKRWASSAAAAPESRPRCAWRRGCCNPTRCAALLVHEVTVWSRSRAAPGGGAAACCSQTRQGDGCGTCVLEGLLELASMPRLATACCRQRGAELCCLLAVKACETCQGLLTACRAYPPHCPLLCARSWLCAGRSHHQRRAATGPDQR